MTIISERGHTHEDEKVENFEAEQKIMDTIKEVGFEAYAKILSDLPDAFDLSKHEPAEGFHRCLCCMDGRTPKGIHSAGSGALMSAEARKRFTDEAKPDSVSWHTGCGAAKLLAQQTGDQRDPDIIAEELAEAEARRLNVPCIKMEVVGPHKERVCYFDATGEFNFEGVNGLPNGFIIGRKYMTAEESLNEVSVAQSIAFGDHGFGELFTKENPFVVVVVAETEAKMNEKKKELASLVASFGEAVVIDGFVAQK